MSDIKTAKYAESKLGITKDGHTMFDRDIVKDLNRKSHLEAFTVEQQSEIAELKAKLSLADAIINKRVDNDIKIKAQIERYQKLVCQTCDGHGAVGNILDSMDCPDCTLYVGPSEEIAALKAELEQHDDEITNIEIVNQELMVSVKQQAIRDAIFNSEQIDIDGHKYVGLEDLEVNILQLGVMHKIPMGGRGSSKKPRIVIIDDGNNMKDEILALLDGDFAISEPIEIKCHDLPCEAISTYDLRQLQSFTPPHKKNRRSKFKRSGR